MSVPDLKAKKLYSPFAFHGIYNGLHAFDWIVFFTPNRCTLQLNML